MQYPFSLTYNLACVFIRYHLLIKSAKEDLPLRNLRLLRYKATQVLRSFLWGLSPYRVLHRQVLYTLFMNV